MAKISVEEFGKRIKEKRPELQDFDNVEIGRQMLEKYPQYQDRVTPYSIFQSRQLGPITGFGKEVARRPLDILQFGLKGGEALTNLTSGLARPGRTPIDLPDEAIGRASEKLNLNPVGTPQKVGAGIENALEYYLTSKAGAAAMKPFISGISNLPKITGTSRISRLASNVSTGATKFLGKTVTRAIGEGVTAAGTAGIQTGGDQEAMRSSFGYGSLFGLTAQTISEARGGLKGLSESWYQRILKPKGTPEEQKAAVQTGLKYGIALTEGGMQKTANLIDDFERQLEAGIQNAKSQGATVDISGFQAFKEEAKKAFNTTDIKLGKAAAKEIDRIFDDFIKKYGLHVPVELAQQLKKNTYTWLSRYYGQISAPAIEGNKQLARALKEGILDVVPIAGNVNKQLAKLYQFDDILQRAVSRLGNQNFIGLPVQIAAAIGGKPGAAVAGISQVSRMGGLGSYGARTLNWLGTAGTDLAPKNQEIVRNAVDALKALGITFGRNE